MPQNPLMDYLIQVGILRATRDFNRMRWEDGKPIRGIKRHPNVGDDVTIYAEATILGDITLGEGTEIGGNVWLTHSVPAHSRVHNVQPKPRVS